MKDPEVVMAAHRDQIEPGNKFLAHWEAMIVDALVEEVGSTKAIAALRPYYVHAGMALAQNALKTFGRSDNVLENLIVPYNFLLQGHMEALPFSIRDNCAIGGVRSCLLSYCRPEICVAFSHTTAIGICEAIDPNYEIVWTEHLTEGAPVCHFVIKQKNAKISDLEKEPERKRFELPKLERELREYVIYDIPAEGGILSLKGFIDACGSERAVEVLRARARNWGSQIGFGISRELGFQGNDLECIANTIDYFQRLIKQTGDLKVGDSYIEKHMKGCPLSSAPPEHCEVLEAFFNGLCESINPDYEFRYDQMMTRGCETCHWTISKKRLGTREETNNQPSIEDPARALALRYARGEITEEELERRMAVLRRMGLVK